MNSRGADTGDPTDFVSVESQEPAEFSGGIQRPKSSSWEAMQVGNTRGRDSQDFREKWLNSDKNVGARS